MDIQIVDLFSLIDEIRYYEPNLVRIIFYMLFTPCYEDREGKHKYIRAMPKPGTNIINEKAFFRNKNLTWVMIDNTVKTISKSAFEGCISLKKLYIPNSVENIQEYAFSNVGLNKLIIPRSIKVIRERSFENILNLKHLIIPNTVIIIEELAFHSCKSLTHLTIGNSVRTIKHCAFYSCKKLTNVRIGKSVKSIGTGAFRLCKNLSEVSIPHSVKNIGDNAFAFCSILEKATIPIHLRKIVNETKIFPQYTNIKYTVLKLKR